ncbi:hypothetical protein SFRURICE_013133, partial [Spodoptera frugiperda]
FVEQPRLLYSLFCRVGDVSEPVATYLYATEPGTRTSNLIKQEQIIESINSLQLETHQRVTTTAVFRQLLVCKRCNNLPPACASPSSSYPCTISTPLAVLCSMRYATMLCFAFTIFRCIFSLDNTVLKINDLVKHIQ